MLTISSPLFHESGRMTRWVLDTRPKAPSMVLALLGAAFLRSWTPLHTPLSGLDDAPAPRTDGLLF
jgi:hypothetical protein